ncbi:MAG: diaminopimelate decarboxylase [Clostridium baratii]|uniref:Diaminopimelate decarboxylase n=1 Tax=Clostridium baratii str. Sullivan TaxID=1415775 RepID=A0A0A7FZB5_9CLOT|nr:diaminopimelate decarboxylase [Clostridium baratii]AIY84964.1 diaminopimelate decarboxylase [Clostridium baratii str. Sullivan]MBS6007165.1 diaminopimelate decarboxylase [Clostridium baratii]MDU1054078.1 diaminopimelate decarboxylase [Clostridium baratii]CUP49912.1 diaminopimelate decarboxylase [Clostridium baratii]
MKLFGTMKTEENSLVVGGIKATKLVEQYGTPLYVMDEEFLRNNCREYYSSFKCGSRGNKVAYAGKAFLTLAMCNLINEEGLYLDVVSGGELYTAYKAGFPLDKVLFHGNNKTLEEIDMGVRLGVGTFVVDNLYEIEQLNQKAKEQDRIQNIYLRITPGIEAHTHEYIKTGQIDSKFGFAPIGDNIINAINRAIKLKNVNLRGLHCHIGSQIFEIEPYEEAAEVMIKLMKRIEDKTGYLIEELDLGGGFGIYYSKDDSPKETKEYCEAILNKVDNVCKEVGLKTPTLVIEPGRSIVGNTGLTLYTIGSIKNIPSIRKYVSVDGGMTDNIRPALYNAQYECIVANRVIYESKEKVTISGKCCESGDILLEGIKIPSVLSGDLLAVMSTGAYGYSMANNYNKIPRPAVVMVRDGESRVICKRESYEDMIRNEVG